MGDKVLTAEFRVSFPSVFTAKPPQNGQGKAKFEVTMLFPKTTTDMAQLQAIVMAAITEKWAGTPPPNLVNPIKDGDTNRMNDGTLRCEKYPEFAGNWYIVGKSVQKVGLVDNMKNVIIDENEFYAGCYARATVHAFAYGPTKANATILPGVGFGLNNVQKLRDGDSFSGRSRAEDDFDAVMSVDDSVPADNGTAVQEGSFKGMFG